MTPAARRIVAELEDWSTRWAAAPPDVRVRLCERAGVPAHFGVQLWDAIPAGHANAVQLRVYLEAFDVCRFFGRDPWAT